MMVINGIDAQTNAHQAGVRHNWSGRIEDGFPAFTALVASIYGQQLPLAFLSNGGYRETAGLTTFTLMNDPSSVRAIVNTNQPQWGPKYFTQPAEMSLIDQARQQRLQRLQQKQQALAQAQTSLQAMVAAQQNQAQLAALEQHLPADLVEANSYEDGYNPMLQQVQMVLASCKAGLTVAADLSIGGFDSHSNHDMEQSDALTQLENGIDYLWSQAEQMGLADRLRVFITSDFSRTPHYNEGAGKDHWPISSAILMQKNANWRQSVVGQTDAGQHAKGLNADLSVSARADAPLLQPKHVQQLLRHWAGIAQNPTCQRLILKPMS